MAVTQSKCSRVSSFSLIIKAKLFAYISALIYCFVCLENKFQFMLFMQLGGSAEVNGTARRERYAK